jgi:hypothetical protein
MMKDEERAATHPRTVIVNGKPVVVAWAVGAALLAGGCSRQVPLSQISAQGTDVGVIVTTVDGEELRGRLLSLTEREMVIVAHYVEGGVVEIKGYGDARRVVVDGARVAGDVVGVDRLDGARVARVRRVLGTRDVDRATFHRSGREVSLATTLSLILGPVVGASLGLIL